MSKVVNEEGVMVMRNLKKFVLVSTFLMMISILIACEIAENHEEGLAVAQDAQTEPSSEIIEPTEEETSILETAIDQDEEHAESEEVIEIEIIEIAFGEIFHFGDFEIKIRDELAFIYYEDGDDEIISDSISVGKYFYIPVTLKHTNPEYGELDFSSERWQLENHLLTNTVIYDLQRQDEEQLHLWREPGRDSFYTIMGISHLGWLDEHHTAQGASTYIRGSYSGDGKYLLRFYPDREHFWDDEGLQFVATTAIELIIDVVWPEVYTTYAFETVRQDSQEIFQVGGFQVSIESDIRFDDNYPYFGRNNHYIPMVFTNLSHEPLHLSTLEPTTFAQNGTNPIQRVYFEGAVIRMPELMAFEPSMWMRLELPFFAVTCGQGSPHRTLQLSEKIEDLANNRVTVRRYIIHICVVDDLERCENLW